MYEWVPMYYGRSIEKYYEYANDIKINISFQNITFTCQYNSFWKMQPSYLSFAVFFPNIDTDAGFLIAPCFCFRVYDAKTTTHCNKSWHSESLHYRALGLISRN